MTIWLFGSGMIFVLARVLGGDVNYSQCLGVIGYSVLPLVLIGLLLPVTHSLPFLHSFIKVSRSPISPSHSHSPLLDTGKFLIALNVLLQLVGVAWSTYSAGSLLCVQELQHKKVLLLYPLCLLFIYLFSLYSGV